MTVQTSPPRRAVAGPLALALVFLAIIGASAGAVLGLRADPDSRDRGGERRGERSGVAAPGTAATGGTAGGATAGQVPPAGTGTEPGAAPATPARSCPAVTEQAARAAGSPGGLSYVLYLRTDESQVWICRDSAGVLWYQGHRHLGSPGVDLPAATSDNTLFLADVVAVADAGYVATNTGRTGTTYYRVSPSWLVIDNPGTTADHREQVRAYDVGTA